MKKVNLILRKLFFRRNTFLSIVFFLLGICILLFIDFNIKISSGQEFLKYRYEFHSDLEVFQNKPIYEWIVYHRKVNFYNCEGEKLGELMNTPVVYSSDSNRYVNDSLLYVQIYGWVRNKSIDKESTLLVQEDVRDYASAEIIVHLNKGTKLEVIYKVDWTLCEISGYISRNCLLPINKYSEVPRYKKFFSNVKIKEANAKNMGVFWIKPVFRPVIKFIFLTWPVRLLISVLSFSFVVWFTSIFYFPQGIRIKKRKWKKIILLIISGIWIGDIIHLLGWIT